MSSINRRLQRLSNHLELIRQPTTADLSNTADAPKKLLAHVFLAVGAVGDQVNEPIEVLFLRCLSEVMALIGPVCGIDMT